MTLRKPESALDLPSGDQESMDRPGRLQVWGFLLCVGAEQMISHASANIEMHVGLAVEAVIGQPLNALVEPDALHDIRGRMQVLVGQQHTERMSGVALLAGRPPYDVAVHLVAGGDGAFVLEAEPSAVESPIDALGTVTGMMRRLGRAKDMKSLHNLAARQIRLVLGFDRVMVYRFDTDGSDEVVGESAATHMEAFCGLRYPASLIPARAQASYCRNWLRIIADAAAPTQALLPLPPLGEPPFDLSGAIMRAAPQSDIAVLQGMGAAASLSISIMQGDRLWGLMTCHHSRPLLPGFQARGIAELFGQMYSLLVERRERADAFAHDAKARAMNDRLLTSLSGDADPVPGLSQIVREVRLLVPCSGVAIHSGGQTELIGITPDAQALGAIIDMLDQNRAGGVFATDEIARLHPPAASYATIAAGMLVIPICLPSREYLIFFRDEAVRTVTWAGQSDTPAMPGTTHLGSVGSFAVMQETMRGHSAPWLETELRVAELLRVALLEATVRRLASAAEARTQAANSKQQELLIAELNHRVRNILALIRALVSRSRESADTLENFVTGLDGRIQSLARAHDQLTDDRWGPVALRVVIENEFHAYLGDDGLGQARLSGPPILVQPEALTVLALVMHELATNSAKYGALSKRQGTVDVTWLLDADGALSIAWREIGGPPVSPPTRRGFGTTVIERIVPFQLQGRAVQRFEPDGLQADFIVPARFVKLGEDIAPQAPVATVPAPAISFCGTAMVLEDNALLALDAEEILLSLGFETVEVVGTAMAALDAVVRLDGNVAFALLDMNLGDHTSMVVAEALLDRGVPFAFATGNGKKLDLPPSLAAVAAIVLKPYRKQDIAGLVGRTMSAH